MPFRSWSRSVTTTSPPQPSRRIASISCSSKDMSWRRRLPISRDLSRALTISDLREMARRRIPELIFEYIEGGSEDEVTLRHNRQAVSYTHLTLPTIYSV